MATYDQIGRSYSTTRRPDHRIEAVIWDALGEMDSVINVGAGTGSYEPPQTALAVEPSQTMISQRSPDAAPAVRGIAEALPMPDKQVDAALAVLTVHHWSDLEAGIAELKRVARRRVVIFTWDEEVTGDFWLLREYLAAAAAEHASHAVALNRLVDALGAAQVRPILVPHDCTDGFAGAYWRRPSAYLDPAVRAGISALANLDDDDTRSGLNQLETDLRSGAWDQEHHDLLDQTEFDAGYRLMVVDL
jgi:SAM-dependent methyltransferase